MRGSRLVIPAVVIAIAASAGTAGLGSGFPIARAFAQQADWKKEFEDICAKTQDAMTLPIDELRGLVTRCDRLKPIIDGLEETERKVFSRRLKACRDLYVFVLESRDRG